ncbi:hypothetical protein F5Y17DRAFT_461576 [Xylariaceae sp. FL0594]|nr:hypothetical protein F5Y17DRAFT_461576 [Xylariaceae sp. FL0594]
MSSIPYKQVLPPRDRLLHEDSSVYNDAVLTIAWEHVYYMLKQKHEDKDDNSYEPLYQKVKEKREEWRGRLPDLLKAYVLLRIHEVFSDVYPTRSHEQDLAESGEQKPIKGKDTRPGNSSLETAKRKPDRAGRIICAVSHIFQFFALYGTPDIDGLSREFFFMSSGLIDDVFGRCPRLVRKGTYNKWHLATEFKFKDRDPKKKTSTDFGDFTHVHEEPTLNYIFSPESDFDLRAIVKRKSKWTHVEALSTPVHLDRNLDLLGELELERWSTRRKWIYHQPRVPTGLRTSPGLQDKYHALLGTRREEGDPSSPSQSDSPPTGAPDTATPHIRRVSGLRSLRDYYDTILRSLERLRKLRRSGKRHGREEVIYRRRKIEHRLGAYRRKRNARNRELRDIGHMLDAYRKFRPRTELPGTLSSFNWPARPSEAAAALKTETLHQLNDRERGSYLEQAAVSLKVLWHCRRQPESLCSRVVVRKAESGWQLVYLKERQRLVEEREEKKAAPKKGKGKGKEKGKEKGTCKEEAPEKEARKAHWVVVKKSKSEWKLVYLKGRKRLVEKCEKEKQKRKGKGKGKGKPKKKAARKEDSHCPLSWKVVDHVPVLTHVRVAPILRTMASRKPTLLMDCLCIPPGIHPVVKKKKKKRKREDNPSEDNASQDGTSEDDASEDGATQDGATHVRKKVRTFTKSCGLNVTVLLPAEIG